MSQHQENGAEMNQPLSQSAGGDASPAALLCLLSAGRDEPTIAARAIELAKSEGLSVYFVYIVNPAIANAVFHQLTDAVFVGERPSEELAEAIIAEHRLRGEDCLRRAMEAAQAAGVPCGQKTLTGEIIPVVQALRQEMEFHQIVLGEPRPSPLRQFLIERMGMFHTHALSEHLQRLGYTVHIVDVGG
jgi:nucleotide-binding universal stress UspA family protein